MSILGYAAKLDLLLSKLRVTCVCISKIEVVSTFSQPSLFRPARWLPRRFLIRNATGFVDVGPSPESFFNRMLQLENVLDDFLLSSLSVLFTSVSSASSFPASVSIT